MNVIGLEPEEQVAILRMLAIILWLGNVQFDEQEDGNARISDTGVSDFVAYLMETESASVEKVLTTRVVETQRGGRRGQFLTEIFAIVPLTLTQALFTMFLSILPRQCLGAMLYRKQYIIIFLNGL